ncbi:MAG: OmpA family protein [Proteobacteria bacterium]|nr:OmpA family protein [Pseudomonadota bacterium]MBU1709303.1 OmpA family protein [Pseudomonadota bacterium]
MLKKILLLSVILLLSISAPGCVMKKTFDLKDEEAKLLDNNLQELQSNYDTLTTNSQAQANQIETLNTTVKELTQDKENLIADNQQLDSILKAKSDSLSQTIAELRQKMADQKNTYDDKVENLKKQISSLEDENTQFRNEVTAELLRKENEVKAMSGTYNELIAKMENEINTNQVTISELKGKLTVNMVDAILFDSGKAEIKSEGLAVLQKVVDILKNMTDKEIRVEGHTDNVPITGSLTKKYPTNWELSAARSINVTRFLHDQGLDPGALSSVAYGEYKPVTDNNTEEGKAQNRRIEIVLAAKE